MVHRQNSFVEKICFLFVAVSLFLSLPVGHISADTWTSSLLYYTNHIGIDPETNTYKLKNSIDGTYTAPYYPTGYGYTEIIAPEFIAKWGTLTISSIVPTGTSISIKVLDKGYHIYSNTYLSGNEAGFTTTTIDLSGLPVTEAYDQPHGDTKFPGIVFRIYFTSDTTVTPELTSLSLSYTPTQGDLTASGPGNWDFSQTSGGVRGDYSFSNTLENPYFALRWIAELGHDAVPSLYLDTSENVICRTEGARDENGYFTGAQISSFNRLTGATNFSRKLSGAGFNTISTTITANNTLYTHDIFNDIFGSFDLNDGSVKWIYAFTEGGHGLENELVGADGTIYTIRTPSTDLSATLYSFSPSGSVNWIQSIISGLSEYKLGGFKSVWDGAGHIIIGYQTYSIPSYANANYGKIMAFSATDGSTVWSNDFGDVGAIISDSAGNIIAVSGDDNTNDVLRAKKVQKFDKDGNSLWQTSLGSIYDGYQGILDQGNYYLLVPNQPTQNQILISKSDGSIVETSSESDSSSWSIRNIISNSVDRTLIRTKAWISGGNYSTSTLFVTNQDNIDKFSFTSNANNYQLLFPIVNSSDQIFFSASRFETGTYINYDAKVFALFPWTLTPTVTGSTNGSFEPGDTATFSVNTSMLTTNVLTTDPNYMQVYIDNGDIVPLTYSSTASDGNTVWTGTYTIPSSWTSGDHTYTVEASAADVTTDITTHFASPASGSGNTGYTTTGTLSIDTSIDTSPGIVSPKDYCTDCTTPSLIFTKAVDSKSGLTSYRVKLDANKHRSYTLSDIPTNGYAYKDHVYSDNKTYRVTYTNETDDDTTNDRIEVYFYDLDVNPLLEGKHTWEVMAKDALGNESTAATDFFIDLTPPTLTNLSLGGIHLSANGETYTLSDATPTLTGTFADPFVGSSREAPDGQMDTFDPVASGPHHFIVTVARDSDKIILLSDTILVDTSKITTDSTNKSIPISYTFSKPVGNGSYEVTIEAVDAVDNTYRYPPFSVAHQGSFLESAGATLMDTLNTMIPGMDFFPGIDSSRSAMIQGFMTSKKFLFLLLGGIFFSLLFLFFFLLWKKKKKKKQKE